MDTRYGADGFRVARMQAASIRPAGVGLFGLHPKTRWQLCAEFLGGRNALLTGIQLDEVAFPIMLAWRLWKLDGLGKFDIFPFVERAALFW